MIGGDRRAFRWVSSTSGPPAVLDRLQKQMYAFYREPATRRAYQAMVDTASETQEPVERALVDAIVARRPSRLLEVGAGSARLYRRLRASGFAGDYIGLDLAPEVLATNRQKHPEAQWICAGIDDAPALADRVDVAFAYFVLEHCVYPQRVLVRLGECVAPDGVWYLVFPDFVATGRFASQSLGFRDGRAGELLRRGRVISALVTLYDARVRLPRALQSAAAERGAFPVNVAPRCLTTSTSIGPDEDAVYVASRAEIVQWATANGWRARFPAGETGPFRDVVFVELSRQEPH